MGRGKRQGISLVVHLVLLLLAPLLCFLGGLGWVTIDRIQELLEQRLQEEVELIARSMQK